MSLNKYTEFKTIKIDKLTTITCSGATIEFNNCTIKGNESIGEHMLQLDPIIDHDTYYIESPQRLEIYFATVACNPTVFYHIKAQLSLENMEIQQIQSPVISVNMNRIMGRSPKPTHRSIEDGLPSTLSETMPVQSTLLSHYSDAPFKLDIWTPIETQIINAYNCFFQKDPTISPDHFTILTGKLNTFNTNIYTQTCIYNGTILCNPQYMDAKQLIANNKYEFQNIAPTTNMMLSLMVNADVICTRADM